VGTVNRAETAAEYGALEQLRAGNIAGLEVLVRMYQQRAVRVAYAVTRDLPLAEDVVSASFIAIFERAAAYDPQRPFEPWFLKIVTRNAIKAAQRAQAASTRLRRWLASNSPVAPDPATVVSELEEGRLVQLGLQRLPAEGRAILMLRYYLDLPLAEISSVIRVPEGTCKRKLYEARQQLRSILIAMGVDRSRSTEESHVAAQRN
jgi:RNA polymerase sigma-70 factor (ECF subfamily)